MILLLSTIFKSNHNLKILPQLLNLATINKSKDNNNAIQPCFSMMLYIRKVWQNSVEKSWLESNTNYNLRIQKIFRSCFHRSYEVCNYFYQRLVSPPSLRAFLPSKPPISDAMFCAGSNGDPNIRTDNGDSGGPVFLIRR